MNIRFYFQHSASAYYDWRHGEDLNEAVDNVFGADKAGISFSNPIGKPLVVKIKLPPGENRSLQELACALREGASGCYEQGLQPHHFYIPH